MKNFGQVAAPLDAATKEYVDGLAPVWESSVTYAAGDWCQHNGELWHNTSGAPSTGVEPGKNYNVWNVTYSNENLLDNPFFTINQRGLTKYGQAVYFTVDRWKKHTNGTVSVGGDITVTQQNGQTWFGQVLDAKLISALRGKTVTASLYADDISGLSTREWVLYSNALKTGEIGTLKKGYNAFTFTVRDDAAHGTWDFYVASTGDDGIFLKLSRAKLELGAVSTLYNDTVPDYGAEFVKCVTSTADPDDTYANKTLRTGGSGKDVTLTGAGDERACYITINGVKYISAQSITVPVGTDIVCTVKGYNATYPGTITLNGTRVARVPDEGAMSYTFTVTEEMSAVSINFTTGSQTEGKDTYYYGTIDIVTT